MTAEITCKWCSKPILPGEPSAYAPTVGYHEHMHCVTARGSTSVTLPSDSAQLQDAISALRSLNKALIARAEAAEKRYQAAVHGRMQFRQAFREARAREAVLKARIDREALERISNLAAERAAKNAGVAPQLLYAPILWTLQDALHGDHPNADLPTGAARPSEETRG
ncbi:hypothetical protein ABEG18_13235 [Alsobacter sp. KACC 23698]|uniref:DUF2130 domain-containing protein n=1 Tax=Alsobacter sp. KACC 23698 TaxID=3149229 RepID=A0AAU7J964_9HYPH